MTSPPCWAKVAAMFAIVAAVVEALLSAFKPRASLVAENLALRQQLAALRREVLREGRVIAGRVLRQYRRIPSSRWRSVVAKGHGKLA